MRVIERVIDRQRLTGRQAILASFAGAAFTAVCAQVMFHLPGNPVPVTMQVFAVFLCGLVLGGRLAAVAQIEYIAAGMMGAPIFTGFKPGVLTLAGPTVGYLIGFVAAAYIAGTLAERAERRSFKQLFIAGLLGVVTIYTCGFAWLSIWAGGLFKGVAISFVGVDAVKAALAAGLVSRRR